MPWPETAVESWKHLSKIAGELAKVGGGFPAYICRGQADAAWDLRPSLCRVLPQGLTRKGAHAVEKRALESFMAAAHLHLPDSWLPQRLPPASLAIEVETGKGDPAANVEKLAGRGYSQVVLVPTSVKAVELCAGLVQGGHNVAVRDARCLASNSAGRRRG